MTEDLRERVKTLEATVKGIETELKEIQARCPRTLAERVFEKSDRL
jgi:chaperonin cofactor prefoldin